MRFGTTLLAVITCNIPIFVNGEDESPGTLLVQRKAEQRKSTRREKQWWDVHNYLGVSHHKAGVIMFYEMFRGIWNAVGEDDHSYGVEMLPCYEDRVCYNFDAPVRLLMDFYNMDRHKQEIERAGSRGLRVAGPVRNPLIMIASAYCYHHKGREESSNIMFFPAGMVVALDAEDGVAFVADRMSELVENMTGVFEHPRKDVFRVPYEIATRSSEDFDRVALGLIDFWFEGLDISAELRQKLLEAARFADLRRNPNPADQPEVFDDHHSTSDCMKKSMKAVFSMPAPLLEKYQSFARRLGYPATEDEVHAAEYPESMLDG
mmetsp:Transcript_48353/g.90532  ORF Transcript_48353/g.90532 Transcript_48353/m.90532 type:complete len:319 (-) Transcript_48353:152-1108(-)